MYTYMHACIHTYIHIFTHSHIDLYVIYAHVPLPQTLGGLADGQRGYADLHCRHSPAVKICRP